MIKSFKCLLISFLAVVAFAVVACALKVELLMGISFWLFVVYLLLLCNKKSILQTTTMENPGVKGHIVMAVAGILTIAICILPMDLSPFWNGQIPMHRNQYEVMADSILDGHLYMDYEVDERLLAMENPYDYDTRVAEGIDYHYDHAFYNGHYYMYFGVVPVFVLFIPFKLIFGKTLVTFHATQFFSMLSVIAFFLLFYLLSKKFFKKLPIGTYIFVTVGVIFITIGYITQAPALYCTAIGSAICFMLWSILSYSYAVFIEKNTKRQLLFAVFGALLGALAFGCRPPVAIANLIAIPLAITYAREYPHKKRFLIRNFVVIAIPYIIIGAGLMMYNYVRFENPFEFGQSYQLTTYDQSIYTSFSQNFSLASEIELLLQNFFTPLEVNEVFPYLWYGGLLVTYPLMGLTVPLCFHDSLRKELKKDRSALFTFFLIGSVIFITLIDVYWSPGLCERYRLDEYFVLGIFVFMLIGYRFKTLEKNTWFSTFVCVLAVVSMLMAFLLFLQPNDANFTAMYPEKATEIMRILLFKN